MPPLEWDSRPDGLRAPAMVCAFKGWNDAGDAASAALQFLGASLDSAVIATGRECGTSASSAPSDTTICVPSTSARSMMSLQNERQRIEGSEPQMSTRSRGARGTRAA